MRMKDLATAQFGEVWPTRVSVPNSCMAAEIKKAKKGATRERYFLGTSRVGTVNACCDERCEVGQLMGFSDLS